MLLNKTLTKEGALEDVDAHTHTHCSLSSRLVVSIPLGQTFKRVPTDKTE